MSNNEKTITSNNNHLIFLDKDGQSFAVDNKEYIFWFDKKTSVKLFNTKRIFFLSSAEDVIVEAEKLQDKILLVNINDIKDNLENYILDKDIHTTNFLTSTGYKLGESCTYISNIQMYLHCIYFLANSDEEGIYKSEFIIDGNKYFIAAEFIDEEESLNINLKNMGVGFSDKISSALNGTAPDEIFTDYTILNNKLKELLFEYMNIIGNMGSYDSLINSLKWFGYGENIKIYEFWRNATSKKYDLSNIEDRLFETLTYLIKYYQKTTYIGLFYLLNKVKLDKDGNVIYEIENSYIDKMRWAEFTAPAGTNDIDVPEGTPDWINFDIKPTPEPPTEGYWPHWYNFGTIDTGTFLGEPVPALEEVVWNYNNYDLYLKMCLLSKYFQKYFMPVHLDIYDIIGTKSVFTTIKNLQYATPKQLSNVDNIQTGEITYKEIGNKFYVDDCTAWINQSNKWNTFVDTEVGYYGPLYNTKPGDEIHLFNENTIEHKIPAVFITSESSIEKQEINNTDKGLEGFYIITDCGVKIPISFEYNKNNIYQKFDMYIYFAAEYNKEWPKNWNDIKNNENYNRYYFSKKNIDDPYNPIDETLNIFVNRQGHYLIQSIFTDYYGTQVIVNKEFDVLPSKVNFDMYKLVPNDDIIKGSIIIDTFEGMNYISKTPTINKDTDNYIGYKNGEPIKGSYSFDFLNKDYFNSKEYNEHAYNKYSSQLFFFGLNEKDDSIKNNEIILTNNILFIKLNEKYGDKIYWNSESNIGNYYIKYSPNVIFYGKDKTLTLDDKKVYSLNKLKILYPEYEWTLKEGDGGFGSEQEWNTILVGIKKDFGKGLFSNDILKQNLKDYEWYSQYRLLLDLYTLKKIDTLNEKILPYTLVYLKPSIDNTYFAVDENGNNIPKWTIENESILYDKKTDTYIKKPLIKKKRNNYIYSGINEIYHYNTEAGYYSIAFQCKLVPNGTNVKIEKKNVLKIEKEDY